MHWEYPARLWAQILILLLLAGEVGSAALRRTRFERFGSPSVLGFSGRTVGQIVRVALMLLGTACVAAILAGPVGKKAGIASEPSITVLLDCTSQDESSEVTQNRWEAYCDTVALLSDLAPNRRLSVYCSNNAAKPIVHETYDGEGLLMILSRMLPQPPGGGQDRLRDSLASILAAGKEDTSRRIVLVSSRAREALTRMDPSSLSSGARPLVLRLPQGGEEPSEFCIPEQKGIWTWNSRPDFLRGYLDRGSQPQTPHFVWNRLSAVQLFALAGYLMLLADFTFRVIGASRSGGANAQ